MKTAEELMKEVERGERKLYTAEDIEKADRDYEMFKRDFYGYGYGKNRRKK